MSFRRPLAPARRSKTYTRSTASEARTMGANISRTIQEMRRPSFWAFREVATWRPWTMSPREDGLMIRSSVIDARRLLSMAFQGKIKRQIPPPRLRRLIPIALKLLGGLIALTPEPILKVLCVAGGELILWGAPRRRRLLRSNLHHAFHDRPRAWRRRI